MESEIRNILIAKYEVGREDEPFTKWTYNSSLEKTEYKKDFDTWLGIQLDRQLNDRKEEIFHKEKRGEITYHIFVSSSYLTAPEIIKIDFTKDIEKYIKDIGEKVIIFLHDNDFDEVKLERLEKVQEVYIFHGTKGEIYGCSTDELTVARILACIRKEEEVVEELKPDDFILYEPILKNFFKCVKLLFLPLEIDLKGIEKVLSGEYGCDKAKEYLVDMLIRNKSMKINYTYKLSNLQSMITGHKYKGISIEKVFSKYRTKKNKNALLRLKVLAGLEKDKLISRFMKLLDDKAEKIENIEYDDAKNIIHFFEDEDWNKEIRINSFHDWIEELIKTIKEFQV